MPRPAAITRASRRHFLTRAAAAGGWVLVVPADWLARLSAQAPCDDGPVGELIREIPLYGPGDAETPLGRMLGNPGLDARLFTDLSTLARDRMITPADEVFVRTTSPASVRHDPADWTFDVRGTGDAAPTRVRLTDLAADARPMGPHLIECAGNSNPHNFGLMSAAEWDGVPLERALRGVRRPPTATAVLVSGIDHESQRSRQSLPGASWVIPADLLGPHGAFLATRMNGRPLTSDHGAPVRLVVPGWYGCAWIKWVNELRWVGSDEPATSQMLEFAFRTHQEDIPELARDYAVPAIDTAAMPIRVEQRRIGGRLEYRIVGVVWGGTAPVDRLVLRFGSRDPGAPVRVCPTPATHETWALWTHRWRPTEPGYYDLSLKVADPAVRTRRLALSFYIRRVRIDDI